MENRLQFALEESSKNLQLPVKAEHAKYGNIEGKNPKNKCIVCITSGGIQIREESKSVKLKLSYIWYDLIKIAINVPLLQLTFRQREKNAKKESNDSDLNILIIEILENKTKNQKENPNSNFYIFIQYFSDTIQRVLTPFELKKISFYTSIITEKVKPTFISIMSRLSMILPFQKCQISQTSIDALKSMFFSHQTVFNLSTLKDYDTVIPIALELLPLIDYIEVVKIPEISNYPIYKASSYFLFQLNSVKYIEISGQKDDGFDDFLQKLQKSNVKTISYAFSKLSSQDLESISTSILGSNIHCIEFHDAINEKEQTSFYDKFLTTNMCSHIWSLNFNNTNNLNIPILLQKLYDISSLSLAYCNIEINSTIRLIHQNKMKHLKYLNLSGNLCNETIDVSIKLPSNLTHIMVNDVSWNDKSLTSFMMLVLQLSKNEKNQRIKQNQTNKNKKTKDLYLSISHAITLQHEWSRLFQLLHFNYSSSSMNVSFLQFRNSSHSSYNFSEMRNAIANEDDDDDRFHPVTLRSLAWDENPVDTSFFDFLKECKELETLSLNSCFHETLESSLALFVDYIRENDSLKKLYVAGSKKVHLGKKVIKIIEACLDKKNLKILDLSISKCDTSCLNEFIPLFDEKRSALEVVIIDGIFPTDAEAFLGFLNQIRIMNSKTKISFPSGDCLNLKKQKKISQKQLNEISNIYKNYDSENNSRKSSVDGDAIARLKESDEEKSTSTVNSSNKSNNINLNGKNSISVEPLKHSEFLKQPYFYRYFYDPFIPYYLELDEVNEIRSQKIEEEAEFQENLSNMENDSENKSKNIGIEDKNENENDNFTLLQVENEEKEEEKGEAVEKEENKTFTFQIDDFKSNMFEEEEEEEENKDLDDANEEAIPNEFNNSINIIQAIQKDFINKNEETKTFLQNDDKNQEKVVNDNIENEEEEEEEEEVKANIKDKNVMGNKKQIKARVVNKIDENEEEEIEEEIINKKRVKTNVNAVKNRKVKLNKIPIRNNEEEETETKSKNKRRKKGKGKVISKNKKQIKKKNLIEDNKTEEEEINIKSRKKYKPKLQQNKKQVKPQAKKKVIIKENEAEEEEIMETNNRKNKKLKNSVTNKKRSKQMKKENYYNEEEEESLDDQKEYDDFKQYLNSNISTSFDDETVEKTEVDDTIMNVTIDANELNEYDDFEVYETYELINQFTTPRQAKGSNLNRNVSKNKNIQNKKSRNIKNKQNNIITNRMQIKKSINNNDDDEFQLSPKKQNLIHNFSIQYNLNDFEIIFQNFEPVINNSEIWTNMNEEFSINKLFNNVKIKERNS